MATAQSIFHRTDAGQQACERADERFPRHYRDALEAVQHATYFDVVRACLGHCSQAQVVRTLEDLEAIGLIESISADWLRELHALGDCLPHTGS